MTADSEQARRFDPVCPLTPGRRRSFDAVIDSGAIYLAWS
jgi:hypothetical protein